MPDVGHAQHHIDLANAINTYHGAGLDTTIDATPVDWGVGWVHPTAGSDSYDGATRQTPKATIGAAISAGYRHINVGPGNHSWTGSGANCTLVFYPGVHTFTNAPVVCTQTMSLIGLSPPPQHTDGTEDAAILKGTGTSTDIFQFDNGSAQRWGLVVRNLKFDASTFTRSAIYSMNMNMADIDFNVLYTSANWEPNTYLYYSQQYTPTPPEADSSWSRITRNTVIGAALAYIEQGWSWVNRHNISGNRGYSRGGANATNPFISLIGRNTGHSITDNSFEGMASAVADAAIYADGPCTALYVAGNGFERIDNSSGLAIQLGSTLHDVSNSIIIFSAGHTSASGALQVNADTFSSKTTGWYTDSDQNQILVAGRYNNV